MVPLHNEFVAVAADQLNVPNGRNGLTRSIALTLK